MTFRYITTWSFQGFLKLCSMSSCSCFLPSKKCTKIKWWNAKNTQKGGLSHWNEQNCSVHSISYPHISSVWYWVNIMSKNQKKILSNLPVKELGVKVRAKSMKWLDPLPLSFRVRNCKRRVEWIGFKKSFIAENDCSFFFIVEWKGFFPR